MTLTDGNAATAVDPGEHACWSCATSPSTSATSPRSRTSRRESKPARSPACSATTVPASRRFIKILSGVHQPSSGEYTMYGTPVHFATPRDARNAGIATVFQDLALAPLMSIWRNFFLGVEPMRGRRADAQSAS